DVAPKGPGEVARKTADFLGDPLPPGALARIGTLRLRHPNSGPAGALFSPDGKSVLTFGGGPELALWDVATGKEVRRFRGHSGPAHHAAISPDGRTVASAGDVYAKDNTVRLWDLGTGKELRRFERAKEDFVFRLEFSPDGRHLAVGGKASLFVWDL